ncbi:MAG TPA: MFS transporter [Polyangiaceae bacterium]|nr:MFS transporter [Polyangiaceae bacterium]
MSNGLHSIESVRRRVVLFVFLTAFLDLIGFGIILPLLPFYVDEMHGSAETVGFIFMCFSLTQLVATPLLGRISDRFGRRKVILISLAGNAMAMLAFALATKLLFLPLLFASRIFAGATSGNLAACQAAISDVTTEHNRAEAMGRLGAGINLGLILGPLLGSTLSEVGAWAPPLGAGALALVDLVCAFFLMPETRRLRADADEAGAPVQSETPAVEPVSTAATRHPLLASLANRAVVAVLLAHFLTFLCITNMQVALGLLAKRDLDWGTREVGALFSIFALLSFSVQAFLIGRLVRRFGEAPLVMAGSSGTALGLLLIAEGHSAAALFVGVAIFGAGFGMTLPALTSLASRAASEGTRGFVLGMAQSSGGLARALGPVVSGVLFRRIAPSAPFLGGAAAALLCAAVGASLRTTSRRS